MEALLLFTFFSGLITIFAPCIWPLLPIILSSSSSGGKRKPLGITLGIMLSFAFFTLTISYIVKIIPFDPNILRYFAVVVIGFLGLTLIIPQLNVIVEGFVSRLSSKTGVMAKNENNGFMGGLVTGFSLGIVWSPCAGPILATIATLAATKAVNFQVILITVVYVTGVGIPLFLFATLGQRIFAQTRKVNKYTASIQRVFGVIMILTAVAIGTNYDKVLQVQLLNIFPSYSSFINKIESNDAVTKQLSQLKNKPLISVNASKAPEFTGITKWLNTQKSLTMKDLRGKVVLVDFWTYTCINCIRTLPYITRWYDKYKDDGFVVIGVHTPEFEFEKNTGNVEQAIKQYNIHYPVAQDNDYATWNAYSNQYWPAHYLIDAEGNIRDTHFGEGKYEETEKLIQSLLAEKGKKINKTLLNINGQSPLSQSTPETYLGLSRLDRSANQITDLGNQSFNLQKDLDRDYISYGGVWNIQSEYAESTKGSVLALRFYSDKVFLVLTPQEKNQTVRVMLDGKNIADTQSGEDVKNSKIILDNPRLYTIVDLKGKPGEHTLNLYFDTAGIQAFAFTFGQ